MLAEFSLLHLNLLFIYSLTASFLLSPVLVKFHLVVVTSCLCSEIFVRRVVVGGCSRMEVVDRSSLSYGQSQTVLGTPGVSW